MPTVSGVPEWVDEWLTIEQPVTYWSFWMALLRLVPVLLVPFVVVYVGIGEEFAVRTFAPLPFVFIAPTLGYAVRAFDGTGALFSLLFAIVYSFFLWVQGTARLLLTQPTPMLSVLAVLTFIALVAGFASPAIHGKNTEESFEDAREDWRYK